MSEYGVVKGFEQPFTIKNQNTQLNKKKRPLRVKPIMDKKKCPYGFPGIYIYIYIYIRYPLLKKLVARLVMPRAGKKRIAPLGYHELAAIVGISATIMMGM